MVLEAQDNNAHYRNHSIDAVDVADAWGLDKYLFSALKYIQRRGSKLGGSLIMDMAKAAWYIGYYATNKKTVADMFMQTILDESYGKKTKE